MRSWATPNGLIMFQTNNLNVSYGKIKALHNVSVTVKKGEIVTLIGANGAGKSTFLKTVSGLKSPESGSILFEGDRIDGLPGHKITQRGIVQIPEGRRIFPLLTTEENLMMGAYFHKDHVAVTKDLKRIFETFPILKDRRNQLGGTLSGGEQQMLAFGRALMSRPKLLILDEPSMGLAPVIVDKVFETIREINKQGVTIFLVEQNARAALSVSKRGYVMETGKVVLEGPTKSLMADDQVKKCYLGIQESHII